MSLRATPMLCWTCSRFSLGVSTCRELPRRLRLRRFRHRTRHFPHPRRNGAYAVKLATTVAPTAAQLSHSTPRESSSEDSETLYSEGSCFLCDYVAAKARSAAVRPTSRAYPECPPRNLPSTDTPSPPMSDVTAESGLDDVDARRFADGAAGYSRSKTAFEGRRQGSPYWLRGTPKREDSESTESDTSVEERLKATLAELRQRLAEADKRADDDRPLRKRPRQVKKSVLLSPSVRGIKRAGSSGTSRKRHRSETEVSPEDESSPDANMSPHAERVLRRLHDQHVRFAVQSASSASVVAVDAEQLQRKYEELQERHASKIDALQRDLARSRRLNELEAQRQLHQTIDALRERPTAAGGTAQAAP
ncbi:uncharacterized protein LOC125939705 [Dermacentor silvarum]|uniref:uncharacterized protein LOC125939705 n=1 Tax=Dermacentor silvarum TaxID=543639 RepID=UPI002101A6C9|nr:uncharacterized protein LOC125939705 [Dermacentor silvarum]XP_049524119.1 uncharacterized protein LOC125939705 [Dermacentor silvarum]